MLFNSAHFRAVAYHRFWMPKGVNSNLAQFQIWQMARSKKKNVKNGLLKLRRVSANNCGRQEEPAMLTSRLLLRMRRMYVDSIRLDFH